MHLHLVVREVCPSSSHHVCATISSRTRTGEGRGWLLLSSGTKWKLYKLPILTFDFLESCQRAIPSCKRVWEIESLVG